MFYRETGNVKIHNIYKYNALLLDNRYQVSIILILPTINVRYYRLIIIVDLWFYIDIIYDYFISSRIREISKIKYLRRVPNYYGCPHTHIRKKSKKFNISDHCHGPTSQIIECKIIKNVIKRKVVETNDTPSSIYYQDSIPQVENIITSQISKCSAKSIVKRQRKSNMKEPNHISDFNDLSVDKLSGKKFLIKTVK